MMKKNLLYGLLVPAFFALSFMSAGDATPIKGKWIRSPITHDMTFSGQVTIAGTVTFEGDVTGTATDLVAKTVTFGPEYDNGDSGSPTKAIAWSNNQKQMLTMNGDCTLTFTAPGGVGSFLLKIVQSDADEDTITWPATVKWAGGTAPTISTASGAIDFVAFYYDGTSYYGSTGLDFK